MAKSLTQITFDFGAASSPADEPVPVAAVAELVPVEEVLVVEEEEVAPPVVKVVPKKSNAVRGRRSLKEAAMMADTLAIPEDEVLFQKSYYPIGEVAKMFRENQSLIRYWETEFDILKPKKNGKGDRFFRPVDVKNLVLIHDLLRRRKFTIEGAKDYLRKNKKAEENFTLIQSLEKIKAFLLELKTNL